VTQLVGVMVWTQIVSAVLGLLLLWRTGLISGPQEPVAFNLAQLWRRIGPFYGLALADVLLQRVDILLLSVIGDATLTGIYSAAYNLVRVALKLVQSFWKALYPTLSRLQGGAVQAYARLATLGLYYALLIVLPLAALSTGVAVEILQLVYGAERGQIAPVFQILIWSVPFFLLENYAVTLFMVEQRAWQSLAIIGLHVLTILVGLPLLTVALHTTGAAWSAVLAGGVGAISSLWWLRRLHMPIGLSRVGLIVAASTVAGLACALLPWPWWVRLLIGGLLYLFLLVGGGGIAASDRQAFRTALFGRKA